MTKNNALIHYLSPLALALGVGALIGGGMFLLGKIAPILLLAPLLAGVLAGVSVSLAFPKGYSPLLLSIVVVLMSCTAYFTKHFGEYHDFKQNISEHLLPESTPDFLSKIVETVATPFVDDFFELKTGHSGFRGYMIFSAEQPTPVGFGKVIELERSATWVLRIFELIAIVVVGLFVLYSKNRAHQSDVEK